jgi:hypothetical protein
MNAHIDPEKSYGEVHMIINGSTLYKDFNSGGIYFLQGSGQKIDIEQYWSKGDLILFNACKIYHGVAPVDPDEKFDWLTSKGRYTFSPVSVDLGEDNQIKNSIQLGEGEKIL